MNLNPTVSSPERKNPIIKNEPIIHNELKEDFSEDDYQNDGFTEEVGSPSQLS